MRFALLALSLLLTGAPARSAFDDTLKAHGGLDQWRAQRTMRFDVVGWPFAKAQPHRDKQVVDLATRNIRIDAETYHVGFDGQDVWIQPSLDATGAPPRFYAFTPFYFAAMPFVFADPGAVKEELGVREVNGKPYDAARFTFKAGTGDSPDDSYIAYSDPQTHRLWMVDYNVTHPALAKNDAAKRARHAIVFDEWQSATGGLLVPKRLSFHDVKDGTLGQKRGGFSLENVGFFPSAPDEALFKKPADALVDRSHR